MILGLFGTVLLLVWMGFFMLGSLPLLVLKHDTPLDAGFIRGLFNVYYTAVVCTGTLAAAGYALAQRPVFVAVMVAVAAVAVVCRRTILARMDAVRSVMTAEDRARIRDFRRLHIKGMVLNGAQLLAICVGMTRVSLAG